LTGLDSNILVYALDPLLPEHERAKKAILGLNHWYVNPTVIHEAYHALVFKRKMRPVDVVEKLTEFMKDDRTRFLNQTRLVSSFALALAEEYNLGGRDSLIIGCFYDGVSRIFTHDEEILKLGTVDFKGKRVKFEDSVGRASQDVSSSKACI
jgi:predicted nucleic acid-binding protein